MRRAFICICFCLAPLAEAQEVNPDRLDNLSQQQEAEKQREAQLGVNRKAVLRDIGKLKSNLTKMAAKADKFEQKGREIENRLSKLTEQETNLKSNIYGDRQALTRLLAALQRIEANPPPALAVTPGDAADAARAARLMTGLSADLKTRADKLGEQLKTLEAVRGEIQAEQAMLMKNETALSKQRSSVKTMVSRKAKLEASISRDQKAARQRVAALAAEAESLRELIQQFERAASGVTPRLKPKPGEEAKAAPKPRTSIASKPVQLPKGTAPFPQAKGKLRAPVKGRISQSYSAANKGITVKTRDKAGVVAPYAGRIEFAGAFKNYDNVVILNVGSGYFILLTGLGETYVEAGEMMKTGEPIGLMPFNTQTGSKLYIEIRKNGSSVNPGPWLGTAFAG